MTDRERKVLSPDDKGLGMDGEVVSQGIQMVLTWVGFGTLVGLLAKTIVPGNDPGGALGTVILGILGTVIGAALLAFYSSDLRVTPISVPGFLVALAGTSLLLVTYRLISGQGQTLLPRLRTRRTRRRVAVVEE